MLLVRYFLSAFTSVHYFDSSSSFLDSWIVIGKELAEFLACWVLFLTYALSPCRKNRIYCFDYFPRGGTWWFDKHEVMQIYFCSLLHVHHFTLYFFFFLFHSFPFHLYLCGTPLFNNIFNLMVASSMENTTHEILETKHKVLEKNAQCLLAVLNSDIYSHRPEHTCM